MAKLAVVSVVLLGLAGFAAPVQAADLEIGAPPGRVHVAHACPRAWTCVGTICRWRSQCRHYGCPDGFGCYPLYGAYGPWGGFAYWSDLSPRF